jgi:hypothetical protein
LASAARLIQSSLHIMASRCGIELYLTGLVDRLLTRSEPTQVLPWSIMPTALIAQHRVKQAKNRAYSARACSHRDFMN